jgi:hypothetical protein
MASQFLLHTAHTTLEEARRSSDGARETLTVAPETRMALFNQMRVLLLMFLRGSGVIRCRVWNVSRPTKTHSEFVQRCVNHANQRRHVRGLPDMDFDIPSYVGILPIKWEHVVDFCETHRALDVPHLYACVRRIARAAEKAYAQHAHVAFCMVDFERIETEAMCMIGVQVFFAVPMPEEMTPEEAGHVSSLPVGGCSEDLVAAYVNTLTAAQQEMAKQRHKKAKAPAP